MINLRTSLPLLLFLISIACLPSFASTAQGPAAQDVRVSVVEYQTEDGWTIQGDLYLPATASRTPIPAAVLLSEPDWEDRSIYDAYLGPDFAKNGIAVLAIDVRGTGKSLGQKEFDAFSPQEVDRIQLDIRGAIKFLSSQQMFDPRRIAVVGSGIGANYAVLEASQDLEAIQALILISAQLSQAAKNYIAGRKEIPIFFLVGMHDKASFKDTSEAFYLSNDKNSEFMVGEDHGPVMFTHTEGMKERVAQWLVDNLTGLGTETPVSFQSEDGWSRRIKSTRRESAYWGLRWPAAMPSGRRSVTRE